MALFAVNTGCRDQEICNLRWDWEVDTPLGSVFIVPAECVKNGRERLVILNHIARAVIDEVRGIHPEYVFTYKGKPLSRMLNTGWKKARKLANLPGVRVHDLKHTFGRRLRAAEVSFEDRQDLLGHKNKHVTTHYSAAQLTNLIAAANKVCGNRDQERPVLIILKRKRHQIRESLRSAA
jgi:integrase